MQADTDLQADLPGPTADSTRASLWP